MSDKRLAVFASGQGSNFKAILEKIKDNYIPATIGLCITDNPEAGAIDVASSNDIPVKVFTPKDFPDKDVLNDAILRDLLSAKIDYIILAGYLKMIGRRIVDQYSNKILNIHPALLPSFGGKGMYGHHVHEAVFERGVKFTGVTIHLVNNEYDAGPIVLQKPVSIENVSSPDDIAKCVLEVEHELYPEAVKLLVEESLEVMGLRVRMKKEGMTGND